MASNREDEAMATENRPRGRPPGEGKNDSPYLVQVADLVVSDSSLKATTAMKRIMRSRNDWGASDETLLRRWHVKWKAIHPVYLAAARDRAESLRRAAEARSWVQTLRQWDETIKALHGGCSLFAVFHSSIPYAAAVFGGRMSPTM
jgi:hypothetical protein